MRSVADIGGGGVVAKIVVELGYIGETATVRQWLSGFRSGRTPYLAIRCPSRASVHHVKTQRVRLIGRSASSSAEGFVEDVEESFELAVLDCLKDIPGTAHAVRYHLGMNASKPLFAGSDLRLLELSIANAQHEGWSVVRDDVRRKMPPR